MITSENNLSYITTHINPVHDIEIHRIEWIIVNSCQIVHNGYIRIEKNRIQFISENDQEPEKADSDFIVNHGQGLLMPPLINAHTHIELSYLKNKISLHPDVEQRFESFAREVLAHKDRTGEETIILEAQKAAYDLYNAGVLYTGEISTTGITEKIFENSYFKGVWFNEILGTAIVEDQLENFDKTGNMNLSYAGHAPHTTSPDLLKFIKKNTNKRDLPFSIHAAESVAEKEFIEKGQGAWADFLTERSIDFTSWNLPAESSVIHLYKNDLLDPLTLLVHVLNADDEDLKIISKEGARVCVCPRSNMNLHGKRPDIKRMLELGIKPAIGTDSLASCDSLSIFDEMKYIAEHYNNIDPADIIAMATQYGADALGFGKEAGSLDKGKKADMLFAPVSAETETELLKKIMGYE